MVSSGSVPGQITINFSCILDQYITQTLSSSLDFQLLDSDILPVGEVGTLDITGYITVNE
jgi:hypothetical protein